PDRRRAARLLVEMVEHRVVRQHQVGSRADDQVVGGDAPCGERIHLAEQHLGIEGDARPDQAAGLLVEDAGWHQMEGELAHRIDDGVPSIVAALGSYHDVRSTGQQVDDLALAFVTPLATDDGEYRHRSTPKRRWPAWGP